MNLEPSYDMNGLRRIFRSKKRVYSLAKEKGPDGEPRLKLKKLGNLTIATGEDVARCLANLPDYTPGLLPTPKAKAA